MPEQIPEIKESTKFNFITSIWIVPFIALLIAGWLAYQYYAQLGPEIKIVFPKNEGLQAGQSQIKYRDVPIGTVKKIVLQEDGEGVTIVARMDKSAVPYINKNAKFWIVKPEVGMSGVSGLDTLLSGTYINMYSKKDNTDFKDTFIGLDSAYYVTEEGAYFHLNASDGYNIKKGTPVYYKNIIVGQVEYMNIALDSKSVDIIIFVNKAYIPYIHTDSKFWLNSAVDVDFSNGRLDVNVAPISYLIQGGISFSSSGEDLKAVVPDQHIFYLYKNAGIAESKKIGNAGNAVKQYLLYTEDSIAKLKTGAAVHYAGFDVGHVKDIKLSYEKSTHHMKGEILVEIDTSVFEDRNDPDHTGEENFYQAVEEGLRAKITSTDIITGMLFVDLVFDENATKQTISKGKHYAVLPTVKNDGTGIMHEVEKVLVKLNKLPLKKLITSIDKVVNESSEPIANANKILLKLQKTVENINTLTGKKSFTALPDEVNKALKELTKTLKATKKVVKGYDKNSLLTHQIAETLRVVTETSKEMQHFLEMLNRKPNSLIFGDK